MAKRSLAKGKMYLFSAQGNTNLIVTAHGGKTDDKFDAPADSTIWFCGRHGLSTVTDADDIVNALTGDHRLLGTLKQRGLHPYFAPDGKMRDYELSKFAGKHGGGQYENYETYETMTTKGFDILSPRNRWNSKDIRLSLVLNNKEINKKNYKNVYLSFCRS